MRALDRDRERIGIHRARVAAYRRPMRRPMRCSTFGVPTEIAETAEVRVTTTGQMRVTSTGDTRVVT